MAVSVVGRALGMFALTNVDDLVVLAILFGRSVGGADARRVVAGQYLGFAAILGVSVLGALGAGLLPPALVPYLGLLPLVLGLRAAWGVWSARADDVAQVTAGRIRVLTVATVTFANGGDNIGVYVPVLAASGRGGLVTYCVVLLVLVGVWCGLGRYVATRPVVARVLSGWGHLLLPVVLIGIGLLILVHGGAFGSG